MHLRIKAYVAGVVFAAIAATAAVAAFVPSAHAPAKYLVFLALIGVVGNALVLLLPSGAGTSVASVPFLSAALIAPDWTAVAAIAGAEAVAQSIHRRGWLKGAFNVAQTTLSAASAIGGYYILNGQSLLDSRIAGFTDATWATGLPAICLIAIYFGINTFAVSGAIAINDGRDVLQVWRHGHLSTLGYELLSSPFVFFFAWATVRVGPIGALLLTLPALGLRHLYKTKLELERSHQDMLELMVKAIEARDPYTSGHSRRVQHFSMVIARAIGLSDREVQRIGVAALLHDVGKIHEKYAPLLRKPEKLTPEEWRIMEQHPVDGAALVATAGQLRDLVSPIRHHHERWDGKGYPDGLKGDEIPLASRVITFADTIDAMTTARSYREALSEADVRAELVRCRAAQFDPRICDALLESPLWSLLFAPPKSAAPATTVRTRFSIIPGGRVTIGAR
jgi:putative nucleotidyltransferase with HDIG domain